MSCNGDKIAGINKTAECYRNGECGDMGCPKCWIYCNPPCENCSHLYNVTLRQPEIGDFVVVKKGILDPNYRGAKWNPLMDSAIGRTAWVADGDPVNGYHLRFHTATKHTLNDFVFPLSSLKLAMPEDVKTDALIKEVKKGGEEI